MNITFYLCATIVILLALYDLVISFPRLLSFGRTRRDIE